MSLVIGTDVGVVDIGVDVEMNRDGISTLMLALKSAVDVEMIGSD